MVGWHHQLNGHGFEQILGDSEEQGSLVCCSPWGCKEVDTTERLNNNHKTDGLYIVVPVSHKRLVASLCFICVYSFSFQNMNLDVRTVLRP